MNHCVLKSGTVATRRLDSSVSQTEAYCSAAMLVKPTDSLVPFNTKSLAPACVIPESTLTESLGAKSLMYTPG